MDRGHGGNRHDCWRPARAYSTTMGRAKMKFLLDTHAWLWGLLEPNRLSGPCKKALQRASEVWISPITVWEASLLLESKRIRVRQDPHHWLADALARSALRTADLTVEVAMESRRIRLPHSDPADRFIAATAIVYDLTLVTADARLLACKAIKRFQAEA